MEASCSVLQTDLFAQFIVNMLFRAERQQDGVTTVERVITSYVKKKNFFSHRQESTNNIKYLLGGGGVRQQFPVTHIKVKLPSGKQFAPSGQNCCIPHVKYYFMFTVVSVIAA